MQNGHTPLHEAVFKGHVACVKALLQAGADTMLSNKVQTADVARHLLDV